MQNLEFISCDAWEGARYKALPQLTALERLSIAGSPTMFNILHQLPHLQKLKHLDVNSCDSRITPALDAMAPLSCLTYLSLASNTLPRVPEFICRCSLLQALDLENCTTLRSLPSWLCNLHLTYLGLSSCTRLGTLPSSISYLPLTSLDLSSCWQLCSLPASILNMPLQALKLSACTSLTRMPATLGGLGHLTALDCPGCVSLVALPASICGLTSLQRLQLSACRSLAYLPQTIGHLTRLTHLDLSNSPMMKQLPNVICHLGQTLKVSPPA